MCVLMRTKKVLPLNDSFCLLALCISALMISIDKASTCLIACAATVGAAKLVASVVAVALGLDMASKQEREMIIDRSNECHWDIVRAVAHVVSRWGSNRMQTTVCAAKVFSISVLLPEFVVHMTSSTAKCTTNCNLRTLLTTY